jgi:hypothetical protein
MVKDESEALAIFLKSGKKLSDFKSVIVTGNGSIYLNSEVSDGSGRFVLKGNFKNEPFKESKIEKKVDKKIEVDKSKDGTSNDNI